MKISRILKGGYHTIQLNDYDLKKAHDEYDYNIMTDIVNRVLLEKNLNVSEEDLKKIVQCALDDRNEKIKNDTSYYNIIDKYINGEL